MPHRNQWEGIYAGKKYIVKLTKDEKKTLKEIIDKGKHSAEKRKRAQALLLAQENYVIVSTV